MICALPPPPIKNLDNAYGPGQGDNDEKTQLSNQASSACPSVHRKRCMFGNEPFNAERQS